MTPMNQSSDARLRAIFLKAVDIKDDARREGFLDGACGSDAALRAQIDALLANNRDDSFLEHPAIQIEPPPDAASATTVGGGEAELARTVMGPQPAEQAPPENIRYFGDYEILGEIARGGMGVVYRARQRSLNRTVALKMIRTGRLADDAEVKRFRTEAEAAANLQHPNIVAIHEIGEHEGQHYFSMDYVEGKDLAQLASVGPLPAAQAARHVKAIAEAIAYAHERGTLHRDLKPHNVLIDQHDQPRITDFGLAELTKHDSSLTQEGAVMGSLSYMPPEQASGKLAQMGPHSDVYSIGAVLYHLVTGRAPFAGETAVSTMRQVLEHEPTSPSKLNPKVPQDLETICLKCLQKAPSQRYATAGELVAELERFLNFEPILASPASGLRRTWSWSQNNPWVFAGAFATMMLLFACVAYGMFERTRFLSWRSTTRFDRVQNVVDSPSLVFLEVFALMMALLYLEDKGFRRNYQHRSVGSAAVPPKRLWLHGGLGLMGIAVGMAALGLQIKWWAWSSSVSPMLLVDTISVICALGLNWLGFHRVWEAVGMHETSRFRGVVDKVLERQLAVELRRWSPVKLFCFPLWLLAATVGIPLAFGVWWQVINRSTFVGIFAAAGLLMGIGMLKLTRWVVRERRRLFTYLFAPLVLAAFLFSFATLILSSFMRHNLDLKRLFDACLLSVIAICIEWVGLKFFRGATQTQSRAQIGERRRFPVNPWTDLFLGAGLGVAMLMLLYVEENWRGTHAWKTQKYELMAKGEKLDWNDFRLLPVPAEQDFLKVPLMDSWFNQTTKNPDAAKRLIRSPDWLSKLAGAKILLTHLKDWVRAKTPNQAPVGGGAGAHTRGRIVEMVRGF